MPLAGFYGFNDDSIPYEISFYFIDLGLPPYVMTMLLFSDDADADSVDSMETARWFRFRSSNLSMFFCAFLGMIRCRSTNDDKNPPNSPYGIIKALIGVSAVF